MKDDWSNSCISMIKKIKGESISVNSDNLDDYLSQVLAYASKNTNVATSKAQELILRYSGKYGHFALYDSSERFRIGKNPELEGTIAINPAISREHCVISVENGEHYITDSGSKNGTFLNGERLPVGANHKLSKGDRLTLADMDFTVEY